MVCKYSSIVAVMWVVRDRARLLLCAVLFLRCGNAVCGVFLRCGKECLARTVQLHHGTAALTVLLYGFIMGGRHGGVTVFVR